MQIVLHVHLEKMPIHNIPYSKRGADSMKTYAKLTQIQNDRKITPKQDALFLYAFQQSALLTLKACGTLTEDQFRYAAEKLKQQYLTAIRSDTMYP